MHAKLLSHVQLCATPQTVAHQAPLSIDFARQECWSGLLYPSPGILPDPGIELVSLTSPALAGSFFTPSVTWEAPQQADLILIFGEHKDLIHLICCWFWTLHPSLLPSPMMGTWYMVANNNCEWRNSCLPGAYILANVDWTLLSIAVMLGTFSYIITTPSPALFTYWVPCFKWITIVS